ncbi:F-box protein CPR1 [Linum grandiflorum]
MSDHIPLEVVTNILLRLSVKDLVRCRRVSKQWLAIIDSPQFIRSKLQQSTNSSALFLHSLSNKDNLLCWREEYGSAPIQYPYNPEVEVVLMGTCHGFICLARVQPPHDLVVLNPSTGERHVVTSFLNGEEFNEVKSYGFGYDEISKSYKVVLITELDVVYCSARIYDVRHKTFSSGTISVCTLLMSTDDQQPVGVFHGGAIHWCTTDPWMFGHVIEALDLASETFRRLRLPPNLHREGKGVFSLNIGVVDSCFCSCVLYEKEGKSDIWMMKEYGMIESWTKLYTIQLDSVAGSVIPLGSNAGRILLMFGRGRFVWCDPGRNLVVEAFSGGDETYEAIYCLDSLVKLFQLPEVDDDVEVKRKEHQAKLALRDQDNSSYDDMSSLLSMIHDMDPSIFEEIPTASDEED